jgi:hypothetical protein
MLGRQLAVDPLVILPGRRRLSAPRIEQELRLAVPHRSDDTTVDDSRLRLERAEQVDHFK